MNERIRELLGQAGFSFKYKTAPNELNPGHTRQDLEKFAELIVRECVEVSRQYNFHERTLIAMYEHFGMDATEIFNDKNV